MDELQEIIQDFLVETDELIEGVDQDLVELEKAPDDYELLNKIFRSVHTIKGAAGFLGFTQLVSLVHITETLLNKLRLGELRLTTSINDAILEAVDFVKEILARLKNDDKEEINLTAILATIEGFIAGTGDAVTEPAPTLAPEQIAAAVTAPEVIAVPDEKPAPLPAPAPVSAKPIQTPKTEPPVKSAPPPSPQKGHVEQTIRVETTKLDNVMNLVGELVLCRNRLSNLVSQMNDLKYGSEESKTALADIAGFLNLITSDLQSAAMKTRMQPIKKVFGKFPRVVRDLAKDVKKEVALELSGEETELDKAVIEQINDPLVHIIRNSIDHGIESKDERLVKGKPVKGSVKMSAYYESNNIIIEIADDGKGIDPAKLGPSAVKKGLVTQDELNNMGDKEIVNLVFAPGFSTAEKISNISGRGVGMDVVKTNITKLNGMIDLVSKVDIGCTIFIKLPLTLAIMNALIVTTGEETFAIPLSSVVEIARIKVEQIESVDQKEVVKTRNSVLPLLRLKHLFNLNGTEDTADMLYMVVIGIAEKRVGIVVESLKGQEEVVIKSMGDYLSEVPGIAGATVGGDGKVMLILDIAAIFETTGQPSNG